RGGGLSSRHWAGWTCFAPSSSPIATGSRISKIASLSSPRLPSCANVCPGSRSETPIHIGRSTCGGPSICWPGDWDMTNQTLNERLAGIGVRLASTDRRRPGKGVFADIEQTLIEAILESANDGRLASLIFSWLKVHGAYV